MNQHIKGRANQPRPTRMAALVATAFAAVLANSAHAQTAAPTGGNQASDVGLDRMVITATSNARSKMRSSVSVTDIDQEQIKNFGVQSEAEVLLLIPGIRTEANAGPGGNANITVRGLPIASGGSKYVQLQEDGLPTVQFGDMNFSNNDYWIRFDNNVESVQTLRGGSSSVFASHAPGAVINYISKTGKEPGGSIGLKRGLNYDETRVDGDYGGKLGGDMYYHIGGYYRTGEGARHATPNALEGYQIKGNITKEFNNGKGYFRLNFKMLDEHAPTTPQTFITATRSGSSFGGFGLYSGYNALRDSQYSIYNSSVTQIDPSTRMPVTSSLTDGISVNSKSLGFEFHNELDNGITLDNKFRMSKNSGAFQAQFWNVRTAADLLATGGYGATRLAYSNGPMAGQTVAGSTLVSNGAAINTLTPDMGNVVNDLSVNKKFKLDAGSSLDVRGGLFFSRQNVVQKWSISERVVEAARNGAVIDMYDASGAALTTGGLTGYNNQWGGCCARDINAQFTTTAPYLNLALSTGNWDIDGGIRQESFRASGRYAGSKKLAGGMDVNGDGVISAAEKNVYVADTANPGLVDYSISYTNFSLGANYRVNNDLSVFVRHSKGHRAIADRLLYSANIDAVTGQLTSGGKTAALAPVEQSEIGARLRGKTSWGRYAVAATLYHSTTKEYDYDQTRQDDPTKPNYQGPKLNVVGYKSDGIEIESGFSVGNFGLNANVVYNTEVMTTNLGDASMVGKTSAGVPKLRFTISPRYQIGNAVIGGVLRGQSKVYADGANTLTIGGHYIVNAFANYDFGKGLVGSLNINNLFNKLYPTSSGGFVGGSTSVFGAGVTNGRTISASIRYQY